MARSYRTEQRDETSADRFLLPQAKKNIESSVANTDLRASKNNAQAGVLANRPDSHGGGADMAGADAGFGFDNSVHQASSWGELLSGGLAVGGVLSGLPGVIGAVAGKLSGYDPTADAIDGVLGKMGIGNPSLGGISDSSGEGAKGRPEAPTTGGRSKSSRKGPNMAMPLGTADHEHHKDKNKGGVGGGPGVGEAGGGYEGPSHDTGQGSLDSPGGSDAGGYGVG